MFISAALLWPALASAHVVVTPSQTGVGQELVFNVSSPNERQTSITQLILDIPKGVSNVVPTAKAGWTITTTPTSNSGGTEAVIWSAGQIAVGQRDDFGFSAQVPGNATVLDWKAYQTYADGTVVHWDQAPRGSDDATGNAGPFSVTKVANDITPASAVRSPSTNNAALVIACLALIVSVAAWLRNRAGYPASRR